MNGLHYISALLNLMGVILSVDVVLYVYLLTVHMCLCLNSADLIGWVNVITFCDK